MKQFRVGHVYRICGGGDIIVYRRTDSYVFFEGASSGRRKPIPDESGKSELIPVKVSWRSNPMPVFADDEEDRPEVLRELARDLYHEAWPHRDADAFVGGIADEELHKTIEALVNLFG